MSFQVYWHRAKQSILFNLNLNVFSASVVSPLSHFELSSYEAEFTACLCVYIHVCVCGNAHMGVCEYPHMCVFKSTWDYFLLLIFCFQIHQVLLLLSLISCLAFSKENFVVFSSLPKLNAHFIFLHTCQQFTRKAFSFWVFLCGKLLYYQFNLLLYKFIDFLFLLESVWAVSVFLGMCPFHIDHLTCCHTLAVSPYSPFYSVWPTIMSPFHSWFSNLCLSRLFLIILVTGLSILFLFSKNRFWVSCLTFSAVFLSSISCISIYLYYLLPAAALPFLVSWDECLGYWRQIFLLF